MEMRRRTPFNRDFPPIISTLLVLALFSALVLFLLNVSLGKQAHSQQQQQSTTTTSISTIDTEITSSSWLQSLFHKYETDILGTEQNIQQLRVEIERVTNEQEQLDQSQEYSLINEELQSYAYLSMLPYHLGNVLEISTTSIFESITTMHAHEWTEFKKQSEQSIIMNYNNNSSSTFDLIIYISSDLDDPQQQQQQLLMKIKSLLKKENGILVTKRRLVSSLMIKEMFILFENTNTGSILLSFPRMQQSSNEMLHFHLIWSTSASKYNQSVHGREIESIFANHDKLTTIVNIYSNSLTIDSHFLPFVNNGYQIRLHPFHLKDILTGTILQNYDQIFDQYKQHKYYYSHVTDVARIALLYKYGGIYIDYDVIVNKNMAWMRNSISDQDDEYTTNGAILVFDKNHYFLSFVLHSIPQYHNIDDWESIGPTLLRTLVEQWGQEPFHYVHHLQNHFDQQQQQTVNHMHVMVNRYVGHGIGIFYRAMQSGYNTNNYAVTKRAGFDKKEFTKTIHISTAYHIFNGWIGFNNSYENKSFVDQLFQYNCLFC